MENPITPIHANGYCAMYGVGGKTSFFGADIPSPNNIPAQKMSLTDHNLLTNICGDSWKTISYACCDSIQLNQLKNNLAKADALISSCPACKENFYQLFCHFTCSPNQSQFINVLSSQKALNKNDVVNELDFYLDSQFASLFYDSCKNIKFGLTNGYAMDLIGGGAKNYSSFLKFLGDKKPQIGGSPFQINYKFELPQNSYNNLTLLENDAKLCNDSNPQFACACSDCPQICPALLPLPENNQCQILNISCTSFTILISYFVLLISYFSILSLIRYKNKKTAKNKPILTDDNDILESSILQTDFSSDIADLSYSTQNTLNLMSLHSRKSYIVNNYFERVFYKLGYFCSTYPKFILTLSISFVLLFSSFIYFIDFETNPINLWVSPNADAFIQKQKFDDSFGPFYRTQQIILSNRTGDSILQDYKFIEWWFEKESQLMNLSTDITINDVDYSVKYDDICFKPLEDTCVLESFTQYFNGDLNNLPESSNWKSKISNCANSPVECLPSFQQPLKKNLIFGGDITDVLNSQAIVVTLLNNNDNNPNSEQVLKATAWENNLKSFILNNITEEGINFGIKVSFLTEISLEEELNRSTNTDIRIVIISYLVMFAYASYALSFTHNNYENISFINSSFITPFGKVSGNNFILKYLTKTRFLLGLIGILIVLFSVFSSIGFWSFFGLKSTLIIAEVIPFLILAVGVDNIFLICNEFANIERLTVTSTLQLNEKIAKTMANIGPSILLSSSCQFVCFILGSFVGMPAVKNFSLYISIAIIFNTLLQITAFISVLALDQQRLNDGKLDLLPFIKIQQNSVSLPVDSDIQGASSNDLTNSLSQMLNESDNKNNSPINKFFKNQLGPFIFKDKIKSFILFIFVTLFGISLSLMPNLQLGLDQRLALPSDSYLIDYFDDIYSYLNVGPPVYFVIDGIDVTKRVNQKDLCSKFTTCESYSLVNIIEQEYKRSNESTISEPVSSWIDDFLMWLNPDLTDCCTLKKNKSNKEFCPPFSSPRLCEPCYANRKWDYQMHGFPENEEFMEFFNVWIDSPSYPCPLGGKAPYSSAIDYSNNTIIRSSFRTSHIPLRSQNDFITAYHNSLRIVNEVKENVEGLSLFAYSPFYIFFVQYETIKRLTFTLISIGMLLIGLMTIILLGSLRNSIVFVINLILIIIGLIGWMVLADISLNAVSLVNLLICLGLSVEFSIHLFKHFNFNESQAEDAKDGYRKSRAYGSLVYVGTTTLSGITLTKLIGIGVLSFTRSKMFRVYYFKMWAGLIVLASVHALVVAPLLLSIFGSSSVYGRSKWSKILFDEILHHQRETL
jgi:Niemann-Pick C1 protein